MNAAASSHSPSSLGGDQHKLAVVIPTQGRPARLAASLAALGRQTAAAAVEIIVVDDGSVEAAEVADTVARAGARLVRRATAGGVGAARNEGVRVVEAPYVCFTDDDCEAAPDWAELILAAFESGADAVAGSTVNGCPNNPFDTVTQLIVNSLAEQARRPGEETTFGAGSNLGATRELLLTLPFDERYRGAGEERDWCAKVAAGGFRFIAVPDAVVVHKQELDARGFLRKHVHYGRGALTYRRLASTRRPLEQPSFYGDLMRRAFKQGPSIGMLFCVAQIATAVGFLLEFVDGLSERRSRR